MTGSTGKAVQRLWPADHVERWPLTKLIPYARNARTHSPEQIAQIAASMLEWGWTNPVLVAEDAQIIAGHGRVLAAQSLEWTEAPVMMARGWSEAQRRAYVIADNALAASSRWDKELLSLELGDLQRMGFDTGLTGLSARELAEALGGGQFAPGSAGDQARLDQTQGGFGRLHTCPKCGEQFRDS